MAATAFIIAVGIFVLGAAVGLVAFVSIGIKHEERLFREDREFLQEQDSWTGPDGPTHFFLPVPPGLLSHAARALTGLWIRRPRGTEPEAIPEYERQH